MIYSRNNKPNDHELKRQALAICLEDLGSLMKGEYPDRNRHRSRSKGCSRKLGKYIKWVKSRLAEKYQHGDFRDIIRQESSCQYLTIRNVNLGYESFGLMGQ